MSLTTLHIGHSTVVKSNKKLAEGGITLVHSFLKNNRFYQIFSDKTFTVVGLKFNYEADYALYEPNFLVLMRCLEFTTYDYEMVVVYNTILSDLIDVGFISKKEVFNLLEDEINKRVKLKIEADKNHLEKLQKKLQEIKVKNLCK